MTEWGAENSISWQSSGLGAAWDSGRCPPKPSQDSLNSGSSNHFDFNPQTPPDGSKASKKLRICASKSHFFQTLWMWSCSIFLLLGAEWGKKNFQISFAFSWPFFQCRTNFYCYFFFFKVITADDLTARPNSPCWLRWMGAGFGAVVIKTPMAKQGKK